MRRVLPAEPAQVPDRTLARRLLVHQPWNLQGDAAQWIIVARIRSLCHRAPAGAVC